MPTIVAANNLTIQVEPKLWSLYNGRTEAPVVEADPQGLVYQSAFANLRKLPSDGRLSSNLVTNIVVGWAVEDSAWHLGLMLSPEIAMQRGGRWCGLAKWEAANGESARSAGEALADTLDKPFRWVPPVQTQPAAPEPHYSSESESQSDLTVPVRRSAAATMPPVPLMPLPIATGEWVLTGDDTMLLWQRARAWRNKTTLNLAFFIFMTLLFAALSLGAKLSIFAPVQPDLLPIIGIGLAVIMLGMVINQLLVLIRVPTVVVDNHERFVRVVQAFKPNRPKSASGRTVVQAPYEGIEYILVSHVVSREEENRDRALDAISYNRIWPEVWIHMYSPRRGFIDVCYVNQTEGRVRSDLMFRTRRPLDLREIDTPAHHAAMHMSQMMEVPIFVEER